MKHIILLLITGFSIGGLMAQGNSHAKADKAKNHVNGHAPQKSKDKDKEPASDNIRHEQTVRIWEGTAMEGREGQYAKHTPNKVGRSFRYDYPHAVNVTWTKYRGDWTATFNNGPFVSTAVYHANGRRKDTRTPIVYEKVPAPVIKKVEEKRKTISLGGIIKIELPSAKDIYRVKTTDPSGKPEFLFYDTAGNRLSYDY